MSYERYGLNRTRKHDAHVRFVIPKLKENFHVKNRLPK